MNESEAYIMAASLGLDGYYCYAMLDEGSGYWVVVVKGFIL